MCFVAVLPYLMRSLDASLQIDRMSHYLATDGYDETLGCLDAPVHIPSGALAQIDLWFDGTRMQHGARQVCILRDGWIG